MNSQNIKSFSSLTPSYLLKVTKFLLKISQFELQKNIFAYKLFLSLNISDLFFYVKIATPLKKVTPFPATYLQKLRSCQAPLFENFRRFNPPPSRSGGNAFYVVLGVLMIMFKVLKYFSSGKISFFLFASLW